MKQLILLLLSYLIALFPWHASVVTPAPAPEELFSTVSIDGEFEIYVPYKATVGPGPAYIPWQFNLLKGDGSSRDFYDSIVLADIQPVTDEMALFEKDFSGTSAYLLERAQQMFGAFLQDITFETIEQPDSTPVYVMRLRLDDGLYPMEFTSAWRFEKSYAVNYLGVNLGDKPDMDAVVLKAAASFRDHTAAPRSADPKVTSTGTFTRDPGPWALPVPNVLGVIDEYALRYDSFRMKPGAGETAIVWQHDFMEIIARMVAGKPEGFVYPSDLAHITSIDYEVSDIYPGTYTFTAYGPYEQADIDDASYTFVATEPIRDLDGLEHFSGAQMLRLSLPDVRDVSALQSLERVERAMLSFSPEITDLSPMGGMGALQYLMMWGYDCSLVEDISFFASLTNLETVFFIDRSVSDASVFARLPALTKLYLNAADTLDQQPLIDCEQIEQLMLNGTSIR